MAEQFTSRYPSPAHEKLPNLHWRDITYVKLQQDFLSQKIPSLARNNWSGPRSTGLPDPPAPSRHHWHVLFKKPVRILLHIASIFGLRFDAGRTLFVTATRSRYFLLFYNYRRELDERTIVTNAARNCDVWKPYSRKQVRDAKMTKWQELVTTSIRGPRQRPYAQADNEKPTSQIVEKSPQIHDKRRAQCRTSNIGLTNQNSRNSRPKSANLDLFIATQT